MAWSANFQQMWEKAFEGLAPQKLFLCTPCCHFLCILVTNYYVPLLPKTLYS